MYGRELMLMNTLSGFVYRLLLNDLARIAAKECGQTPTLSKLHLVDKASTLLQIFFTGNTMIKMLFFVEGEVYKILGLPNRDQMC